MKRLLLSLPLLTVCLAQQLRADAVIVFNEIMYHPATNEPALEWVELRNALAVDVDISGWSLTGGINYTFASNTFVRGRGFLVVAISPGAFTAATGVTNVLGPFSGRLGNNGDTVRLRNNSGRLMDEVVYGVEGDWPVAADGAGVSLAKRDPDSASAPAGNWTASEQMGGTPGARNFALTGGFVAPPGLVSYWAFNEPSGPNIGDQAGANSGTLGGGVTRTNSALDGALSFNGASGAFVNVGAGAAFNVSGGLTIEAVLMPGWSSTNSAVIFRKAPVRPTNYVGAVLASQPIAYWRLDDTTTTIADATANNRTGTAGAGVQLSQPGLIASEPASTAARFSGANRITVNGFEKIGAAGYSVEFWVRPHILPNGCCQNLVGDGEAAGDYFMMNYILGPQQGLVGAIRPHYGPANSPVSLTGATALQVENTYHIVTTWNTSLTADNAIIYINGVPSTVGTITRNVPAAGGTGNNRIYIGKDDRDTTDGTETIDEVALYNRPLSAADVAAHYAAGATVNFDATQGNAIQLAFQNDGNNAAANPPVAAGPVLSFGITVGGTYSELDLPLDGAGGRPTLAALEDGQPHHVAVTFDSATGLKAIYVDGVLAFSTTLVGALTTANLATAVLGNSEINGSAPFVGALDEMAYWGRALSAAEVAAHSSAVQAGRGYFEPDPAGGAATLAFNEVSASTNAVFWLELANYGADPVPLAGFVIQRDGAVDNEYVFPAGPAIPAGGFLAVSNSALGFLPADGDRLFLLPPARNTVLDAIVLTKGPRARSVAGAGPWLRPNATTPGAANSFALRTDIVINEIMYNHALLAPLSSNSPPRSSPEAWVELFNKSSNAVDLVGWELTGGISYFFTPGQSIPAGGYLVVADDVPYLRTLHPGIDIVGDFGGRLSGRSDRIVLRDPAGNPADEVRYYDGPPWPSYADGGGSSLELRDPNADNSKAEAWAASDETAKTSWQTYSYRLAANIPSGSGQPTQWQDFILGLQSAGECLIDDLSVIETPGATPVEVIANGNFENGLSGWRVLGTHNRTRVEPEPGNPGNNVLRVIATGSQEHMHNHIERTLNAGRTITSGREYQISYRARWLAGNNLLNTRLYFNRSGRTTALPMPALNGTPGAPNSRLEANAGPTFSGFGHQRVVPQPGEPVTVNVVAQDPHGVASAEVFYSVNSGAWASAAMTHQGGGAYTGTIPGQSAGAVVQFYARAADGLGAAAAYPARGTNSGALYKVNDGQANLPLAHNVRVILTPDNINLMHGPSQGVNQTNVMSNDLLPCTVIYDEARAYYDCGVHLRGSQRGRYSDVRTGFHINFPLDDLFRGVHPVMLVDRSGAGDAAGNRQEEIVLKHMLNRAGSLPGTYPEIARVIAPRAAHTGPVQFFPRHEDNFIETAFENGGDGQMWEMELIYYPTTANAAGYKNPQPDAVVGTDITNLGDDKETYRYNFMIKNRRDADDYRSMIALGKAWSLSGPALDAATRELMDIDQWMRAYALISLCSVGDMYTFGNNHNWFMYQRASDGKFLHFPWDMDFVFARGANGALVGDQNLGKIVSLPGNLRLLYAHMLDIIGVSFNTSYMTYWTDHYDNFAPGQSYAGSLSTIGARATFVRNTINAATGTNFTVNGGATITTNSNLILLTGTAPAQVKTIWINGVEYPVTWTSVANWRILVSVSDAANVLNLVGHDIYDRPLTNFSRTVTVNYTGTAPDPAGVVVINEIMYNPAFPDAAFLEVFNTSATTSFDLSGWRINGLDYTFPKGSVITNRQYLVLAGNIPAYFAAYGTNVTLPFGRFSGNLQNDGETLTLLRPVAAPGQEIAVDKVRYEGRPPWPTAPNGAGPSLQLVDAAQDNSRVGNWSAGGGWRYYTFTGTIAGGANPGTNFLVFLNTAGDVYLDDLGLVTGTQAGVGPNLIVNGGFESPLSVGWELLGNHTNSVVSTDISRSGGASMHLIATGLGGSAATLRQILPALPASTVCTLSYWFLPTTTASNLSMRTVPGSAFASVNTVRPVLASPGAANSAAAVLPPFPPLWLNEAQPENLTGITDSQGEREPWVELYNAGPGVVSLAGFYLADNYTNIAQWAFPPGAELQPGEFKIIFADGEAGESTAGEWHTSFRLGAGSGEIALAWSPEGGAPQVLDYLTYTNILAGRSYGDFPDGQPFDRQEFYRVTPGGTNDNVAPPIVVFINEWMAANTSGLINTNNGNRLDDWFELYNPGNTPANLAGYYLTDNLANRTQFLIPTGYVVPPRGFLLAWADNRPNLNTNIDPALHVSFALSQNGDQIGLYASDGTAIDTVDFLGEPQFNNISEGRFPDATGPVYFLATPTPLAPNSIWANRNPALAPIPNASLVTGETLAFTAIATDPDLPPQLFTYSLAAGAPTNAAINATNGVFTWMPSLSQTPSTNSITVRVTDSGLPALSAARTFTAVVIAGFRISGITQQPNGDIVLNIGATVGKTYRVEYKDGLNAANWTQLGTDQVATATPLVIIDNLGGSPQRFYRVTQLD